MILDEICAHKREEVARRRSAVPVQQLEETISQTRPARNFRQALRTEGISLVAEIKRASPSKGILTDSINPVELAGLYEEAGASAISVLTDERFFKGSFDDLMTVHQGVAIPCLQKDFIVDEYQVYEARAHSADAILLIVRVLSDQQMADFLALARSMGMAALVETHSADDIERALNASAHIIGINNRDLATFRVDLNTTLELRKLVPGGNTLISESGICTREHVKILEDGGVDGVLVGEALVTSKDIGAKIRELLGRDKS